LPDFQIDCLNEARIFRKKHENVNDATRELYATLVREVASRHSASFEATLTEMKPFERWEYTRRACE
jgi:hypothetical protein